MKTKTIVAPAMDLDMYAHPTTKRNIEQLEKDGVRIIPADSGELASGLVGEGRMAEPEDLYRNIAILFYGENEIFRNKKILITAGPTHEDIDPVRFIGNHSSGKMGYSIATEFLNQGAEVVLISGPTNLKLSHPGLDLIKVASAEEMMKAVQAEWEKSDIGVFAAAVADYRPEDPAQEKIKKAGDEKLTINLIKNPDILKWAGEHKSETQYLVGFALETSNLEENAKKKLKSKNLDMIVMNTLQDEGAGFGVDTNKISILDKRNNFETFELKSKNEVARDILTYLKKYI